MAPSGGAAGPPPGLATGPWATFLSWGWGLKRVTCVIWGSLGGTLSEAFHSELDEMGHDRLRV